MSKIPIPHSWSVDTWPENVYPHTPKRARYLVRAHRDALMAIGALARVGREIVIIGDKYHRYLERQASAVVGFECPANAKKNQAA